MKKRSFSDEIYDYMCGITLAKHSDPRIAKVVAREFEQGSSCDTNSAIIYNARSILARRLGTDIEDPDIMAIVNCYEKLSRHLGGRMYHYGLIGLNEHMSPRRRRGRQRLRLRTHKRYTA